MITRAFGSIAVLALVTLFLAPSAAAPLAILQRRSLDYTKKSLRPEKARLMLLLSQYSRLVMGVITTHRLWQCSASRTNIARATTFAQYSSAPSPGHPNPLSGRD